MDRETGDRLGLILALGLLSVVVAAVVQGGGSSDESVPWIGAAAFALAAGGWTFAGLGLLPRPRLDGVAGGTLALTAAFVTWNGLTIAWSILPDRSWDYFNRGLVYVAVLAGACLVGALPRAPVRAAYALAGVIAVALGWALAGKVFPALYEDGGRIARLRAPVEYWNALALLFAMGLPVALWLARRSLAPVFLFALVVGLLLTYSRSGLVAAVLAVSLWLAFDSRRREALAALGASVPVGTAVALWAFRQPGLTADGQPLDVRESAGVRFGVALLLGGAAAYGLGLLLPRLLERLPTGSLLRWGGRAAAVLALALLVVAFVRAGDLADWVEAQAAEFANPPTELVTQEPERLTSFSSNNRWNWWREAWTAFEDEPLWGNGAGSFALSHRLLREDRLRVVEPHSEPLQFLAETGFIGFLLAAGAVVAAGLAVRRTLARVGVEERPATLALAIGLVVYLAHSLVDWDWDFLAVSVPAFAVLGVLLGAGRQTVRARSTLLLPVAAGLLSLAAVYSLFAPWAAERKTQAAYEALAEGDPAEALAAANRARSFNPLSLEPLFARATALRALGAADKARNDLIRAVELQPQNPDAWYELGLFELEQGREEEAERYFRRSRELDPFGPAAA
ncbi:MAG: O-antigen ligase family protein [Gaiellales bacterium]